jgi:GDPmannose 4,6-dehydratase
MLNVLITGITGQNGTYLAKLLKEKNYKVYGLVRPKTLQDPFKMEEFWTNVGGKTNQIELLEGEIIRREDLHQAIVQSEPHEIYHFAGIHHRDLAREMPEFVGDVTGLSSVRILEIIREVNKNIKFIQASTSDIFEQGKHIAEDSRLSAQGPYGAAALYAYSIAQHYRVAHQIFACNAICFEHESPLRGPNFIGRSVTRGLSRVMLSKQELLYVSDLDDVYDWGYAQEYVEAMHAMSSKMVSDDYILATGQGHTLREFVTYACDYFGIDITWKKVGDKEYGYDKYTNQTYVEAEDKKGGRIHTGNPAKAQRILEWTPRTKFKDLVVMMCEADFEREKKYNQ